MDISKDCIQEFLGLEDDLERFDYLVKIALGATITEADLHSDENLISGCQSRIWLKCSLAEDRIRISWDSDSVLIKGLIGLTACLFDGRCLRQIPEIDTVLLERLCVHSKLLNSKKAGVQNSIRRIREFAESSRDSRKS